jgi:hypothetical protein
MMKRCLGNAQPSPAAPLFALNSWVDLAAITHVARVGLWCGWDGERLFWEVHLVTFRRCGDRRTGGFSEVAAGCRHHHHRQHLTHTADRSITRTLKKQYAWGEGKGCVTLEIEEIGEATTERLSFQNPPCAAPGLALDANLFCHVMTLLCRWVAQAAG